MVSLVVTAVFVALVGIAQQVLGEWALYNLGYSFRVQLRTYNDHLRSFGTLDEPFAYAAFLLLALAALLMWFRLNLYTLAAGGVIVTGLFFSFVRTAVVVVLALIALWLSRKGYTNTSIFLMALAAVSALVILFASSTATETRTVRTGSSSFLTVNGRTEAWRLFLNDPRVWFLGHGVGKVGTAAERATYKLTQDPHEASRQIAIDSGYFAVIADVGLLGLAAMLAIFGRLILQGRRFASRGSPAGWLALALVTVLMIDAVTRASFTGFPTAFLALLLAGLAVGAAIEGDPEAAAGARHRRSRS
jgi:O-antigen ligase